MPPKKKNAFQQWSGLVLLIYVAVLLLMTVAGQAPFRLDATLGALGVGTLCFVLVSGATWWNNWKGPRR